MKTTLKMRGPGINTKHSGHSNTLSDMTSLKAFPGLDFTHL